MRILAEGKPDGILHVGFGLGIPGMNAALEAIGWMPPRYTTTAFEFAATNDWWRTQLAGWVGLDQYDERNEIAQGFLDRFEARHGYRPEYFFPPYCYDVGRMMLLAIAGARPLTGPGVKDALEKIKMLPAASGAPGTRLRFGRYIRHGWMGSEFLVARRILPDGEPQRAPRHHRRPRRATICLVTTQSSSGRPAPSGPPSSNRSSTAPTSNSLVPLRLQPRQSRQETPGPLSAGLPTGVLATDDKEAILALDADVVLHAASKAYPAQHQLRRHRGPAPVG